MQIMQCVTCVGAFCAALRPGKSIVSAFGATWGSRGRSFKSCRPDQKVPETQGFPGLLRLRELIHSSKTPLRVASAAPRSGRPASVRVVSRRPGGAVAPIRYGHRYGIEPLGAGTAAQRGRAGVVPRCAGLDRLRLAYPRGGATRVPLRQIPEVRRLRRADLDRATTRNRSARGGRAVTR